MITISSSCTRKTQVLQQQRVLNQIKKVISLPFFIYFKRKKKNRQGKRNDKENRANRGRHQTQQLINAFRVLLVYSLRTPSGIARDFWELLEECQGTCLIRKKQPWDLWLPAAWMRLFMIKVCSELWARRNKYPFSRCWERWAQGPAWISQRSVFWRWCAKAFWKPCSWVENLCATAGWGWHSMSPAHTRAATPAYQIPSSQGTMMHLCRPLTEGPSTK